MRPAPLGSSAHWASQPWWCWAMAGVCGRLKSCRVQSCVHAQASLAAPWFLPPRQMVAAGREEGLGLWSQGPPGRFPGVEDSGGDAGVRRGPGSMAGSATDLTLSFLLWAQPGRARAQGCPFLQKGPRPASPSRSPLCSLIVTQDLSVQLRAGQPQVQQAKHLLCAGHGVGPGMQAEANVPAGQSDYITDDAKARKWHVNR